MALAYALHYIETNRLARLSNYAEYLERHPPTHEVQIFKNSSWSCVHGVERWRSDCGCNSGTHAGWNQSWRAPLREALDWLRDRLAPLYERRAAGFFHDPWAAGDAYIDVILDRSPDNVEGFLAAHARRRLRSGERIQALKLLELQRHALLMYTSCGWFFDELSGLETVQVIQYAAPALQLAGDLFGDRLEEGFLALLERAKSNLPEHRDGRRIYEKFCRPAMVTLEVAGRPHPAGGGKSPNHFRDYRGDHHAQLRRAAPGRSECQRRGAAVPRGERLPGPCRRGRAGFPAGRHLILETALSEAAALYRNFYAQYATLARFVLELGIPLPARFQMAVDFTLNAWTGRH